MNRKPLELTPDAEKTIDELQTIVITMLKDALSEVHHSIAEKCMMPHNERSSAILAHSYIFTIPEHTEELRERIRKLLTESE